MPRHEEAVAMGKHIVAGCFDCRTWIIV